MTKYHAKPTVIDGIRFASKAEARHYAQLKLREKAGEIKGLELQPKFPLMVPGYGGGGPSQYVCVGHYIADFRYREGPKGELRIVDVKGIKTPLYRLKKKMYEAQYGTPITEVA